jgi:5-methylcytosine-specific restriction endonuclease McrA
MSYRCRACRQYYRDAPYRRINLGSVCSEQCLTDIRRAPTRRPTNHDGVPADTRTTVYARDRQRCRYCGTTADLHLHHVHYRSEGVDHGPANLITLCLDHHNLVHSDKRYWQPICEEYLRRAELGQRVFLVELLPDTREHRTDIAT